jgi:hypothetical protein
VLIWGEKSTAQEHFILVAKQNVPSQLKHEKNYSTMDDGEQSERRY